jgi:hypothetical protein
MSSSVFEPPASTQVAAALAAAPGTADADHPPASRFTGITRVEVLLTSSADESDAGLDRLAAACGFGAVVRPGDHSSASCGVPADAAPAALDPGGRLRHVAVIERCGPVARVWRDLAVVPHGHLLAGVPDGHAAVVIRRGCGPAVLLATPSPWPEEVLTVVAQVAHSAASRPRAAAACAWSAPAFCAWRIGLAFPHVLPPPAFVMQLLAGAGLPVRRLMWPPDSTPASRCWAELAPAPRADVARALGALHRVHRVVGQAWAVL